MSENASLTPNPCGLSQNIKSKVLSPFGCLNLSCLNCHTAMHIPLVHAAFVLEAKRFIDRIAMKGHPLVRIIQ